MPRRIRGVDLATAALMIGGACLLAASLVAAAMLLAPAQPPGSDVAAAAPTATPLPTGRTSEALPADRVATVLNVDVAAGAGGAVRAGDHVDVLGYFPAQATGNGAITRVLLADVAVLGTDRSGSTVALTLAVPQASALLVQEAQALGAHPYVMLRPLQPITDLPASFSDADLAARFRSGGE